MKYIPDKKLYSAVMFALRMGPSLQRAFDSNIKVAADYYQVDHDEVLQIVREELWERARSEAKKNSGEWLTVYNPHAIQLLNTDPYNNYVLICPHCGAHYSANINSWELEQLYVSQCKCGFVDNYQRKIRNDVFKRLYKEDKK
jgi:hypothetical protein